VDARADVYALGGVLHFALTGRVPFERQGDEAKLWAQLSAPPPVPSTMRRGLRGGFDAVVARAMAKDADHRYPSAGDLGRAAQAAAAGTVPTEPERVVARGAAAPGFAPTEPGIAAEASTRTALPPVARAHRRRVRPGWIAGGVGALAVAILAVLLLTRDDGPGAQVVTPGCGVCQPKVGFLSDGEVCITATTRNFKGRKGSMKAEIYLAGPLTVAAAALAGEIVDPKEVLDGI